MDSQIIDSFAAEILLKGSHVLERVDAIRKELKYASDGTVVSYEDLYGRLSDEVDSLSRLKLETDLAEGTAAAYGVELVMAVETIVNDCDRVYRKTLKFESRLRDAAGRMKKLHGEFGAWYAIAANDVLNEYKVKLSATQVSQLADSEFSRLVDGLNVTINSMLEAINVLGLEIKEHKATQLEKYKLGKDQVNSSWSSNFNFPKYENGVNKDKPGRLIDRRREVEDVDDIAPSNLSKYHTEDNPTLERVEFTHCTKTEGCSAQDGHPGACLFINNTVPLTETFTGLENNVQGTFVKVGTPQPATPVLDEGGEPAVIEEPKKRKSRKKLDLVVEAEEQPIEIEERREVPRTGSVMTQLEDVTYSVLRKAEEPVAATELEALMNEEEPVATPAPTTPRKKLQLLSDDEDIF